MFPVRPDLEEYLKIVDDLATAKDSLLRKEYALEKVIATAMKKALSSGAKTREVEVVKILGNDEEESKVLDSLHEEIFALKKTVSVLFGKVEAWKSAKEIYRTDRYNTNSLSAVYDSPKKEKEEN